MAQLGCESRQLEVLNTTFVLTWFIFVPTSLYPKRNINVRAQGALHPN